MIPQAGSIQVQGHLAVRAWLAEATTVRDFRTIVVLAKIRKEREEGTRDNNTTEKESNRRREKAVV